MDVIHEVCKHGKYSVLVCLVLRQSGFSIRQLSNLFNQCCLSTVPSFVTARTFCASRIWSKILKFLNFWAVFNYVEKADLRKGYHNPKRKLGPTAFF